MGQNTNPYESNDFYVSDTTQQANTDALNYTINMATQQQTAGPLGGAQVALEAAPIVADAANQAALEENTIDNGYAAAAAIEDYGNNYANAYRNTYESTLKWEYDSFTAEQEAQREAQRAAAAAEDAANQAKIQAATNDFQARKAIQTVDYLVGNMDKVVKGQAKKSANGEATMTNEEFTNTVGNFFNQGWQAIEQMDPLDQMKYAGKMLQPMISMDEELATEFTNGTLTTNDIYESINRIFTGEEPAFEVGLNNLQVTISDPEIQAMAKEDPAGYIQTLNEAFYLPAQDSLNVQAALAADPSAPKTYVQAEIDNPNSLFSGNYENWNMLQPETQMFISQSMFRNEGRYEALKTVKQADYSDTTSVALQTINGLKAPMNFTNWTERFNISNDVYGGYRDVYNKSELTGKSLNMRTPRFLSYGESQVSQGSAYTSYNQAGRLEAMSTMYTDVIANPLATPEQRDIGMNFLQTMGMSQEELANSNAVQSGYAAAWTNMSTQNSSGFVGDVWATMCGLTDSWSNGSRNAINQVQENLATMGDGERGSVAGAFTQGVAGTEQTTSMMLWEDAGVTFENNAAGGLVPLILTEIAVDPTTYIPMLAMTTPHGNLGAAWATGRRSKQALTGATSSGGKLKRTPLSGADNNYNPEDLKKGGKHRDVYDKEKKAQKQDYKKSNRQKRKDTRAKNEQARDAARKATATAATKTAAVTPVYNQAMNAAVFGTLEAVDKVTDKLHKTNPQRKGGRSVGKSLAVGAGISGVKNIGEIATETLYKSAVDIGRADPVAKVANSADLTAAILRAKKPIPGVDMSIVDYIDVEKANLEPIYTAKTTYEDYVKVMEDAYGYVETGDEVKPLHIDEYDDVNAKAQANIKEIETAMQGILGTNAWMVPRYENAVKSLKLFTDTYGKTLPEIVTNHVNKLNDLTNKSVRTAVAKGVPVEEVVDNLVGMNVINGTQASNIKATLPTVYQGRVESATKASKENLEGFHMSNKELKPLNETFNNVVNVVSKTKKDGAYGLFTLNTNAFVKQFFANEYPTYAKLTDEVLKAAPYVDAMPSSIYQDSTVSGSDEVYIPEVEKAREAERTYINYVRERLSELFGQNISADKIHMLFDSYDKLPAGEKPNPNTVPIDDTFRKGLIEKYGLKEVDTQLPVTNTVEVLVKRPTGPTPVQMEVSDTIDLPKTTTQLLEEVTDIVNNKYGVDILYSSDYLKGAQIDNLEQYTKKLATKAKSAPTNQQLVHIFNKFSDTALSQLNSGNIMEMIPVAASENKWVGKGVDAYIDRYNNEFASTLFGTEVGSYIPKKIGGASDSATLEIHEGLNAYIEGATEIKDPLMGPDTPYIIRASNFGRYNPFPYGQTKDMIMTSLGKAKPGVKEMFDTTKKEHINLQPAKDLNKTLIDEGIINPKALESGLRKSTFLIPAELRLKGDKELPSRQDFESLMFPQSTDGEYITYLNEAYSHALYNSLRTGNAYGVNGRKLLDDVFTKTLASGGLSKVTLDDIYSLLDTEYTKFVDSLTVDSNATTFEEKSKIFNREAFAAKNSQSNIAEKLSGDNADVFGNAIGQELFNSFYTGVITEPLKKAMKNGTFASAVMKLIPEWQTLMKKSSLAKLKDVSVEEATKILKNTYGIEVYQDKKGTQLNQVTPTNKKASLVDETMLNRVGRDFKTLMTGVVDNKVYEDSFDEFAGFDKHDDMGDISYNDYGSSEGYDGDYIGSASMITNYLYDIVSEYTKVMMPKVEESISSLQQLDIVHPTVKQVITDATNTDKTMLNKYSLSSQVDHISAALNGNVTIWEALGDLRFNVVPNIYKDAKKIVKVLGGTTKPVLDASIASSQLQRVQRMQKSKLADYKIVEGETLLDIVYNELPKISTEQITNLPNIPDLDLSAFVGTDNIGKGPQPSYTERYLTKGVWVPDATDSIPDKFGDLIKANFDYALGKQEMIDSLVPEPKKPSTKPDLVGEANASVRNAPTINVFQTIMENVLSGKIPEPERPKPKDKSAKTQIETPTDVPVEDVPLPEAPSVQVGEVVIDEQVIEDYDLPDQAQETLDKIYESTGMTEEEFSDTLDGDTGTKLNEIIGQYTDDNLVSRGLTRMVDWGNKHNSKLISELFTGLANNFQVTGTDGGKAGLEFNKAIRGKHTQLNQQVLVDRVALINVLDPEFSNLNLSDESKAYINKELIPRYLERKSYHIKDIDLIEAELNAQLPEIRDYVKAFEKAYQQTWDMFDETAKAFGLGGMKGMNENYRNKPSEGYMTHVINKEYIRGLVDPTAGHPWSGAWVALDSEATSGPNNIIKTLVNNYNNRKYDFPAANKINDPNSETADKMMKEDFIKDAEKELIKGGVTSEALVQFKDFIRSDQVTFLSTNPLDILDVFANSITTELVQKSSIQQLFGAGLIKHKDTLDVQVKDGSQVKWNWVEFNNGRFKEYTGQEGNKFFETTFSKFDRQTIHQFVESAGMSSVDSIQKIISNPKWETSELLKELDANAWIAKDAVNLLNSIEGLMAASTTGPWASLGRGLNKVSNITRKTILFTATNVIKSSVGNILNQVATGVPLNKLVKYERRGKSMRSKWGRAMKTAQRDGLPDGIRMFNADGSITEEMAKFAGLSPSERMVLSTGYVKGMMGTGGMYSELGSKYMGEGIYSKDNSSVNGWGPLGKWMNMNKRAGIYLDESSKLGLLEYYITEMGMGITEASDTVYRTLFDYGTPRGRLQRSVANVVFSSSILYQLPMVVASAMINNPGTWIKVDHALEQSQMNVLGVDDVVLPEYVRTKAAFQTSLQENPVLLKYHDIFDILGYMDGTAPVASWMMNKVVGLSPALNMAITFFTGNDPFTPYDDNYNTLAQRAGSAAKTLAGGPGRALMAVIQGDVGGLLSTDVDTTTMSTWITQVSNDLLDSAMAEIEELGPLTPKELLTENNTNKLTELQQTRADNDNIQR